MTTPDPRAQTIADIRALADWLEAHPEVPLSPHGASLAFQHTVTPMQMPLDEDRIAEVRRVAGLIGVEATVDDLRASATVQIGQRASYTVHASTDRGTARWANAMKHYERPGRRVTA